MGALVVVGLAVAPATLPARLALADRAPSARTQVDRLDEVREQLEHRRALQRDLQARVAALTAAIEALRAQGERTTDQLHSERQQARALEQRLDQLVPRLLVRMAEVEEQRAQAARVLAELASRSRNLRLAPTIRARMLALSPVMLARLRGMEHGVASLSAHRARTSARQAQIERGMAELTSARQRLQSERAQKRVQRQTASDRLREVSVEVRRLGAEQTRLAQPLLLDPAPMMAEARTDRRLDLTVTRGATSAPGAAVESDEGDRAALTGRVADAWPRAAMGVVAGSSGPGPVESAAGPGAPPVSLPIESYTTARAGGSAPDWQGAADAASLDVVFAPDGGASGTGAVRLRDRRAAPPILTVPDGPYDQGLIAHGGPDLSIPAASGQGVAAPVAGRVAFAGSFKSYGLLLILEHEGEYHTLLWGFARLDVRHGDQVQAGQIVGIMGARGDDPPVLHVERRRNGRPLDVAASSNGIQG